MGFTMAWEKKIAAEFALRCRKAGKGEKSRILDEYLALSGNKSRKYAIFKLNRIGKTQLRMLDGQAVTVIIDAPVAAMLEVLWKNFNGFLSDGPTGSSSPPSSGRTWTSLS
jgi:hypothetical protein